MAKGKTHALVPLGSLSVAKGAGKAQKITCTKTAIQSNAFNLELVASTSSPQVLGPVGRKFADLALTFTLSEFFTPAEIARWDQYRIVKIEIFARSLTPDCAIDIFHCQDPDDDLVLTWPSIRMRSNLAETQLRTNLPGQVIASYQPRPLFTSVAGDSTENIIMRPGTWFDTKASTQGFAGIKVHCEGESYLTSEVNPLVMFYAKATVQWKGPV